MMIPGNYIRVENATIETAMRWYNLLAKHICPSTGKWINNIDNKLNLDEFLQYYGIKLV